ncbi:MAG TPA: phage tail tape measure protein, partial [Calditerricola sp.]
MATLAELIVRIGADATGLDRQLGKVENKIKRLGGNFEDVGKRLTAGITLPLVGLGGIALKSAIDFESAFAGVRKTVDATDEQLAVLRQGIRDMAKEMPASAVEIARVAEAAGQLGIETENILKFTRVMIDLGVSTNLSADQAATALARLANITQMPQDQFDRLGATIVALGNNLATTEAEIVEMGLRIAGAGHQVGLTEAQILSLAGALSSVGIEAEAGGSAISRVMINIANAVASGGEKLRLFAQVAGMSVADFKRAWEQDAAGALVLFIEGLGRLGAKGENVFEVLKKLGLGEIIVRDALLRAANAGDLFRNSMEIATTAWEENIALTKEAEQRYQTTESQLQILRNRLNDVAITLGDALLPALHDALTAAQPLIDAISRMAEWFANLSPETQRFIITLAGIIALAGPFLMAIGAMLNT